MRKIFPAVALVILGVASMAGVAAADNNDSNGNDYDACDYTGTNDDGSPRFVVHTNLSWSEAAVYNGPNDIIFVHNTDTEDSGDSQSFRCFLVFGTQGPAGPAGPEGPAGADGGDGADGQDGGVGPAGATGSQGPAGSAGAAGAAGPAGPQGPASAPGVAPAVLGETLTKDTTVAGVAEELPRTGVSAGWMAGIGGLLLLLGLATRIAGKRPRGSVVS